MRRRAQNRDEQPLYLFDKTFAETAPELAADFQVRGEWELYNETVIACNQVLCTSWMSRSDAIFAATAVVTTAAV